MPGDGAIPIADPEIGREEHERVREVLDSGMLADGPVVRSFEEEFAAFCGADRAVATANGTAALHAALAACGIGEGDRVVTTPFSFVASANAIRLRGAEPVFADIDPETYNLDPDAVAAAIDDADGDVDAILAVHLYGLPADLDRLSAIADERDLALIEDAAQAHGARFDGDRVGTAGDAACFSFYPTKNMTTGEGGMVVTDDDGIADRAERFVNHGRTDSYTHAEVGHNFRMTSLAAAIGRAQLQRLPDYVAARRENARRLTEGLADAPVTTPVEPDGRTHAYHQYTVRTDHREELRAHLDDRGVGHGVYYPTPIHEQPAYDGFDASAPVAERAAEEVLSLPVHPSLDDADLDRIVDAVASFSPPTQRSPASVRTNGGTGSDRLRAGVVGVGTMGQHHVRVYDELSDVTLVGVADDDATRANAIATEYGTQTFTVDELLDRVDVASVAVPTAYHYDVARQCIDAGVHVLVEKPIVEDPGRGRELVRAADDAGVTLQVGHVERYNPVVETLGEIVPDLHVIAIEAERLGPAPGRPIEDTAVVDLMIHDIDVFRTLVDAGVADIEAVGAADGRHAAATLGFDDGTVGKLTASRVTEKKVRKLRVTAEDCYVTADYLDQTVQIHRQSAPEFVTDDGDVRYQHESLVENPAVDNGEPLKRELASFVEAVRTGADPEVTGREGIRTLELAREINARAFGDVRKTVGAVEN